MVSKNSFDWFGFNFQLLKQHAGDEIIAVFGPSCIKKSGKQTYGLAMFWSGVSQRALKGLEIGCLAFVDVIEKHISDIKSVTRYLAVDGYFMKKEFINPLLKQGLHIITKARSDANLLYVFKGNQKGGRGRRKLYDGKIDIRKPDKRRAPCCYSNEKMTVYAGAVYCVVLKQVVLAAFVYYGGKEKPEIIVCTDADIEAMTMCKYYGLRFQVEFLIRDAKQHSGLEDCMARNENKLHTHFNIAMTAVSVAKVAYHL